MIGNVGVACGQDIGRGMLQTTMLALYYPAIPTADSILASGYGSEIGLGKGHAMALKHRKTSTQRSNRPLLLNLSNIISTSHS